MLIWPLGVGAAPIQGPYGDINELFCGIGACHQPAYYIYSTIALSNMSKKMQI